MQVPACEQIIFTVVVAASRTFLVARANLDSWRLGDQQIDYVDISLTPTPFEMRVGGRDMPRKITRRVTDCLDAMFKQEFDER